MRALSILAVCLIFIFFNRVIYKKFVNFPSVITAIWCASLALSTLGLYETFPPSDTVVLYTLLFIFAINLFSFIFHWLMPLKKKNLDKVKETPDIVINNKLLTAILLASSILLIMVLWDSLMIFFKTGNFSNIRNGYINYETIGVHMQVLVSVTLVPLGRAAYVLSIVDYVYNKKVKSSLIASLLFALVSMALTGGRGVLFFFLLTFLVVLYEKEKSIIAIIKRNKKTIAICGVVILILLFVTFQRGFSDNSILKSLYVYFAGCFNLFGVYLDSGAVPFTPLLFGQALVSGFTFPFIEMLRMMGVNILAGNYILAEQATSKYIAISPSITINASSTTLYPAIRDFGVSGLFIYPAAICFAFQKLKNRDTVKNNILTKSFLAVFLVSALLLNLSYQFGAFQCIVVFVYMYIICKCSDVLIKKGEAK